MTKSFSSLRIAFLRVCAFLEGHRLPIFLALALAAAGVLTYRNAFGAPFIFDDITQILQNDHIQSLAFPWRFWEDNRRPVLYLSLALDFHRYGFNPYGFHAFNVRTHIMAAIFLFLLIRHTCRLPAVRKALNFNADLFAFGAALIWLVHPLQTQAVTYIIQRAESLMGLFFWASLYCSAKYFSTRGWGWAVCACLAAMLCGLTKEVALALPVVTLLYDRTFHSSSFRQALRKSRWLYAGLALMWAVMIYLYFTTSPENKLTAGFGMKGMAPFLYAINQPRIILYYLRLALVPQPLVFDYDLPVITDTVFLLPWLIGAGAALIALFVLRRRFPVICFLWISFLVILAPSSSIIPVKDIIFEYRPYLSLAVVCIMMVLLMKKAAEQYVQAPKRAGCVLLMIGLTALVYAGAAFQRNQVYLSEETVWKDVIRKRPFNARAYNNLGEFYLRTGKDAQAKEYFLKSAALSDAYANVFTNLSTVYAKEKDLEQAIVYGRRAVAIDPDFAIAYNNIGSALSQMGRYEEAVPYFQMTLEKGFVEEGVLQNLGVALAGAGQLEQARQFLEESVRLNPRSAVLRSTLDQLFPDGR